MAGWGGELEVEEAVLYPSPPAAACKGRSSDAEQQSSLSRLGSRPQRWTMVRPGVRRNNWLELDGAAGGSETPPLQEAHATCDRGAALEESRYNHQLQDSGKLDAVRLVPPRQRSLAVSEPDEPVSPLHHENGISRHQSRRLVSSERLAAAGGATHSRTHHELGLVGRDNEREYGTLQQLRTPASPIGERFVIRRNGKWYEALVAASARD